MTAYLENHLYGEHSREGVIKVVQDLVPEAALLDGVFRCQCDAAQADDYHDKEVKIRQVHHPMCSTPNPGTNK